MVIPIPHIPHYMTIFIGNTGNSTVIYGNIAVNIIKPPDFGGAYS